jgi:hypothetical protein
VITRTVLGSWFVVACVLIAARPAYAYLDPATSSFILQILFAAVAAALIFVKSFWHRIRQVVSLLVGTKKNDKNG